MKILGREPAVTIGVASALLSLIVTFNIGLTSLQAGATVAIISAGSSAITAAKTRPIAPAAFTGLVTAGTALLAAWHFEVEPATVGALNALVLAVLMFITRGQVSPTSAGVSRPAAV